MLVTFWRSRTRKGISENESGFGVEVDGSGAFNIVLYGEALI